MTIGSIFERHQREQEMRQREAEQLTTKERVSLALYGCALRPAQQRFYLAWSWHESKLARRAPVSVRFISDQEGNSPLLCVAFEISPVRFLPHYCFYPLDLRKRPHKETVQAILNRGSLDLCLVGRDVFLKRQLALSKTSLLHLSNVYEAALKDLDNPKLKDFRFVQAVKDFQSRERAPRHFAWLFSESDLDKAWAELRQSAGLASQEQRKKLREFVARLYELLRIKHSALASKSFEYVLTALVSLHFICDVYWALGREPDRLVEFLSDIVSVDSFEPGNLGWVPETVDSICGLLSKWEEASPEQASQLVDSLLLSLADFGHRLSTEGGISRKTVLESLDRFKPFLVGKPGRPRADYAPAWKLKREGALSWAKTAQALFAQSPALQTEFGKSRYVELSLEDRLKLISRVRHGVARYEQRQRPGQPKPRTVQ